MSRIQILSDHLVSQIAAGEVVERPASVVKELLENALDAGAAHLEIELEHGGKRLIRVTDDGEGMDRDDALLAFDRHATSKISTFEELEAVETLGFRGEALASIAAISRTEMLTAPEAGEGFRVRIEGGRVRRAEPSPAPRGTSIEVASLFYNVPARRKFLKAPRTELRRATEVVQGYALARPDVGFTLRHGGRLALEAPGGSGGPDGLERRLESMFGTAFVRELARIDESSQLGPGEIWGFVGGPGTSRGQRRFVFVNRRLIRDRAVMATFYRAVRDEWRGEEFPALFLFIDLPGSEVDVNVHPQKAEVRFRDRQVLDRLYAVLRIALGAARGEEPALAVPTSTLPRQPLAWEGSLGGFATAAGPGTTWPFDSEVREPHPSDSPRMAEVSYLPTDSRPVPLSGRSGEQRSFRLLGQYKGTLILLEGADGLYLIDQHVAHERVLYERIRRNLESEQPSSQALIEPLVLELSASELQAAEQILEGLSETGFEGVLLSGRSVAMTAIPASIGVEQAGKLLESLFRSAGDDAPGPQDLRRSLIEEAAASMACRAAVKMHEPMTPAEMEALLSELFEADQPYACPHGRPVILKLSDFDLEKRFKRR
jgi:DNA mismatch repair protein MutL